MKNTYFKYITMLAVALCATACGYENHFLDEDDTPPEANLITISNMSLASNGVWIYINLKTGETEEHPDAGEWIYAKEGDIRPAQQEETIGIEWHIAVHRYEYKTNGALVLKTQSTDIESVTELPAGSYTSDVVAPYETEKEKESNRYLLSMDMAGMMDGNIGYARNPVINRVLCDAITRTATGSMPPTLYTTEKEVLVLKWEDGDWATFQITETKNTETGVSNYMSYNFKYHSAE